METTQSMQEALAALQERGHALATASLDQPRSLPSAHKSRLPQVQMRTNVLPIVCTRAKSVGSDLATDLLAQADARIVLWLPLASPDGELSDG